MKGNLMARKSLDITETELAILDVLWVKGSATIREITAELYTRRTTGEYATVQKLLERLEAKDCVKRDRRSFAHIFTAKIDRQQLIGGQLESLAKKLCNGSLTPLLMHLADASRLSPEDYKMLRRLIDESPTAPKRARSKS
jgi:predicted transcriptional regulator